MNWEEIFNNVEATLLNSTWLQERSKQELMQIIQVLASHPNGGSTVTTSYTFPDERKTLIDERDISGITEFETLPANSVGPRVNIPWRVVFYTNEPEQPPLSVEIIDDIILGRSSPSRKIDLNLSLLGGDHLGVSRIHASIRPDEDRLLLYDLGSSNGTFLNFDPIAKGVAAVIADGDILSFGLLHVKVQIVQQGS